MWLEAAGAGAGLPPDLASPRVCELRILDG
jgi:hypothetical protein